MQRDQLGFGVNQGDVAQRRARALQPHQFTDLDVYLGDIGARPPRECYRDSA